MIWEQTNCINGGAGILNNVSHQTRMTLTVPVLSYLVHRAKDVSIILLEATDTGQACESSRELVSVQDAKVGHAKGQLSPGARPVIKHQTGAKQEADNRLNSIYKCTCAKGK